MKRILTLLLCTALLLCGCGTGQPKYDEPVTFYYQRTEYIFGQTDSVIAAETLEGAQINANLSSLLEAYLQGPTSEQLQNPFPADTRIEKVTRQGTVLQLKMNDKFSQLSGMELTIACACLSKTVLSLTDCTAVQIILVGELPDTQRIITMDNQSLLLMDDIITTTPTETQEGL